MTISPHPEQIKDWGKCSAEDQSKSERYHPMEIGKIWIIINLFWFANDQLRITSNTDSKFKIQRDKWIERRSTDEMKQF